MKFGKIDFYILFGGGQLLAFIARWLQENKIPVLVVTSERHATEFINCNNKVLPLMEYLATCDIDTIVSKDVSSDEKVIKNIKQSTLGLSFGAAWIFKKEFIEKFNGRLLNLHAARLPKDRGAGGFSWRILKSERIGASLIHQVDVGVDTGDIVLSEEYIYPANCRYPIDYIEYTVSKYKELLYKFFDNIKENKRFTLQPQQDCLSTYWPRLSTDTHGYVNWAWQQKDIESFICAFDEPYSGAMTFIDGDKVRLKECYSCVNDGVFHPFQKGIVYRVNDETIFVATEDGSLLIKRVLDENGNDIKNKIKVGQRFYTPQMYLEEAMQYKAVFLPDGLKKC